MEFKVYTVEINPPRWLSRFVPGVLAFTLLVGTSAGVNADTFGTLVVFQDTQVLSASTINANFAALQAEFNALPQVNPDCPWGYSRDLSVTAYTVCRKGNDEVVKVGSDASVFWMDRYEASVWATSDGSGTQYGVSSADYPTTFPQNGQGPASGYLYAISRAGVKPTSQTTWFQANLACRTSGKRLSTSEQWLMAASMSPDPGVSAGDNGTCLTSATTVRPTGSGTNSCTSTWGVDDLIGNLSEWTLDWLVQAGYNVVGSTSLNIWPDTKGTTYGTDYIVNISSSAYVEPGVWHAQMPVAMVRGGDYSSGTMAGVFALSLDNAPSNWGPKIGFRCVILR